MHCPFEQTDEQHPAGEVHAVPLVPQAGTNEPPSLAQSCITDEALRPDAA
jgi:hypothetical protein